MRGQKVHSFSISAEDLSLIKEGARELGLTVSEVTRRGALLFVAPALSRRLRRQLREAGSSRKA